MQTGVPCSNRSYSITVLCQLSYKTYDWTRTCIQIVGIFVTY